jgi:hypothetical protein
MKQNNRKMEKYQTLLRLCMIGIPIFVILGALCAYGWNYYSLKIKELEKTQNEQKSNITISPESIEFARANAFQGSKVEFYEKYTFTVFNPATIPMYNIWIEIESDEINVDLVKFEAKKKETAPYMINTNWRSDTYLLNFIDSNDKHIKLLAISRLGQGESYEYIVSLSDKTNLTKESQVRMKIIKSSNQYIPPREGTAGSDSAIVFSNPLPKTGKLLGFELFN